MSATATAPSRPAPTAADISTVRALATRYSAIVGSEAHQQRIAAWRAHNGLRGGRPLILVFPEGSWGEIQPAEGCPEIADPCAGGLARVFWQALWLHERCGTDNTMQPWVGAPRRITSTGWGLQAEWTHSNEARGARTFKPVLRDTTDLERITTPVIGEDLAASADELARHRAVVGGILPVHSVGVTHVSYHLMAQYTAWRGLEEMMVDMHDEPELLHAAMRRLTDGHKAIHEQYVRHGLYTANADNTYHNSGGNSWCDDLPAGPGPGTPATMWASAESQELAGVCAKHHRTFALAYEAELLAPFAHAGYGCCEALDRKLADVFDLIPRIRRISISPWADIERSAKALAGRRAIFSWKPNPAHLVGAFNEAEIRAYIQRTVAVCKEHDCQLEIILKDTHTCEQKPERFVRWTQLAREAIAAVWGP